MQLAWKNIVHNRVRFIATALGIAFAVSLMIFQGSLLFGFSSAASKLVDVMDADLWITARGVPCFDFSAPLSKRFLEISQMAPGVERASRIVMRTAEYRSNDGDHHLVVVVGADPDVGRRFPVPYVAGTHVALEPDAVVIDESNAAVLEVTSLPANVEINAHRARVLRKVNGFSSFVGMPYVFTSYTNATKYLSVPQQDAMYILLKLKPGYPPEAVKHILQERLPEVDVRTKSEFSEQSRHYWITQTGAGGGILVAVILGFVIGLIVVSQSIYATTMERIEEFATLKALGASSWFIIRVVLTQAFICAAVGSVLGLLAVVPAVASARQVITWILTPVWLPIAVFPATVLMCSVAAIMSIKAALTVEPARVFRA